MVVIPEELLKDCKKIRDKLSAFLDNELPSDEILKVKQHLETCVECERELKEMQNLSNLMGMINDLEPSPDFWHMLSSKLVYCEDCRKSIWERLINIVRDLSQSLPDIRSKTATIHTFSLDVFHDFPPESFGQFICPIYQEKVN